MFKYRVNVVVMLMSGELINKCKSDYNYLLVRMTGELLSQTQPI
jgi:hypothetical protein